MNKIEAIIRPEKLDDVKMALEEKGFVGLTVTEVKGRGRQKGVVHQWRGEKYRVDLLPKVEVKIIVKTEDTEEAIKTIVEAAKTGEIGDGKIFVYPVKEVVRIRTGDKGDGAI